MDRELENKLTRAPAWDRKLRYPNCLQESLDLPCSRIVRCWSSVFDVETYLQKLLPKEVWHKFINFQPKDKVTSIIELIEAAKAKK